MKYANEMPVEIRQTPEIDICNWIWYAIELLTVEHEAYVVTSSAFYDPSELAKSSSVKSDPQENTLPNCYSNNVLTETTRDHKDIPLHGARVSDRLDLVLI